jgi:hypothetical protein
VRRILGLGALDTLDEQAAVEREESSLHVTLRSKDGRVLGDRLLRAEGSCDELAGAVAVVLAAWLSDVHPEFVGTLPESAPKPAPLPPAPAPRAKAPSEPWLHGSFGAAIGADFSRESLTYLGTLGARFVLTRSGFGAAITATFVGARTQPLSSGNVRYFRWPLLLGPLYRVPLAASNLDLQAGVAVSWLHLAGSGFADSSTRNAFAGGGFVSTRVSLAATGVEPFLELTGLFFPPTRAFVQHGSERILVNLPDFELYAALGAALRAW